MFYVNTNIVLSVSTLYAVLKKLKLFKLLFWIQNIRQIFSLINWSYMQYLPVQKGENSVIIIAALIL